MTKLVIFLFSLMPFILLTTIILLRVIQRDDIENKKQPSTAGKLLNVTFTGLTIRDNYDP